MRIRMEITEDILNKIMDMLENEYSMEDVVSYYNYTVNQSRIRDALLRNQRGRNILCKEIEGKIPIDRIKQLSSEGKYFADIADEIGVSKSFLMRNVNEYEFIIGKKIVQRKKPQKIREDLNNDELLELYNSGKTVKEIAVEKHASQTAVRNRIKKCIEKHRIEELTTLGKISKNIDIMQYIKDIEKGTSFDIALEKSGMTVSKFKRALYEKGGERGKTILIKRLEEEVPELPEIIEEYNKNTSLSNISEKLSMTSESISKAFNMYKFLTKDKDQNNKKQQDKETIQVIENNKKGEEHEL